MLRNKQTVKSLDDYFRANLQPERPVEKSEENIILMQEEENNNNEII
jgi:hypothetical protein